MEKTENTKEEINFLTPKRESINVFGRLSYSEGDKSWNLIRLKKDVLREYPQLKERMGSFSYMMVIPRTLEDVKKKLVEIEKYGMGMPILLFFCKEE